MWFPEKVFLLSSDRLALGRWDLGLPGPAQASSTLGGAERGMCLFPPHLPLGVEKILPSYSSSFKERVVRKNTGAKFAVPEVTMTRGQSSSRKEKQTLPKAITATLAAERCPPNQTAMWLLH